MSGGEGRSRGKRPSPARRRLAAWRSPWLEGAATAAATLLFVDAWFDILTSSSRPELLVAIVEAALVELPLAVLCLLIARSAERRLARRRAD
jgi:hypothetical protein